MSVLVNPANTIFSIDSPAFQDPFLYRDIVLVYCPQKVGSTSLVSSIRLSASDQIFTMHTHEETIFEFSNKDVNGNDNSDITVSDVLQNTCVMNRLTNLPRKIYLIDIYRSPMERKISEFFHEISMLHFHNSEDQVADYPIQKIINRFHQVCPHLDNTDYFREKYRLQPEDIPPCFDFNKKYIRVEKQGVVYVKLRLQDSHQWGNILTTVLEKPITAVKDYETRNKKIGELYQKFNQVFKISFDVFKQLENCPQLKYYFNFEERSEYLMKWWKRTIGNVVSFNHDEFKFYQKISIDNQHIFLPQKAHYGDDGCLCLHCANKRRHILDKVKQGGTQYFETNLHNILENQHLPASNSVVVRLNNPLQERYMMLSLIL